MPKRATQSRRQTRHLREIARRALRAWWALALVGGLLWQAGCLARVERACKTSADCQGFASPHVCFEGTCVPGVCEPDPDAKAPQPCFCKPGEDNCDQQPKGACQQGVRFCIDNGKAWSACFGATFPSEEICDGKDNDCDGEIDEGTRCECKPHELRKCRVGMSDAQTSASNSACLAGFQRCVQHDKGWRWGACQHHYQPGRVFGALSPALGSCHQTDLDCDGKPDPPALETCKCDKIGETRPCYTGPDETLGKTTPDGKASPCQRGEQTCIPVTNARGQWSLCQKQVLPIAEESDPCNGKDDDCDGMIDNTTGTTMPLWRRCGANDADCQIEICLADATWSKCELQELCGNQQDDNCDGKVDESSCFKR